MIRARATLWFTVCLLLAPAAATAGPHFTVLETGDLRLVYFDVAQGYLAPHVARCFENSIRTETRLFGYAPSEKVTVLLRDVSDHGNAGAGTVPRDAVSVEIEPVSFAFETNLGNERMNTIMNHELVHLEAQDKPSGSDAFFRKLFLGKVAPIPEHPESIFYFFLTSPRTAAPRWYQEGIAVFVETWMAGGIGRAQGSWDEMVFRAMVRDGSRFYDPLGLVSEGTKIDFQVDVQSYLYGTRFMSYLAWKYSPEMVLKWVARDDGSKRYYSSQFKQVFGLPLDRAWQDWIEFEHAFQQANLEAIRKYPVTPLTDLSAKALGSVSRAWYDPATRKIYAGFNYPGAVGHIGSISVDDGTVSRIIDIKDPVIYTVTSTAYDPATKILFYTTDNHEHRDLRAVNVQTGESRLLLKDARTGDIAFDPADRSIWGVRHFNGIATLVRIPYPYSEWNQVHSFPYGEVVYDTDVSPDGRLVAASFGEIDGRQELRVMKTDAVLAGDTTPVAKFDFGSAIPMNFTFSPDGRYLYGSSYYTGVSNIFRYEVATAKLEAVSNTETGLFRPIPTGPGADGRETLIVFRYTGEGFVPATIEPVPLQDVSAITYLGQQIVEKHPVVKSWISGSPADIPIDTLIQRKGDYHPGRSMRVESLYPVVEGYKHFGAYGFQLNLSDPLSMNRTSLTATWTPDENLPAGERAHVQLSYQRGGWRAGYRYNDADFYDLFGPTKVSRKGNVFETGFDRVLLNDRPRRLDLALDTSYRTNIDALPDYQNVAVTFDTLLSASAKLTYNNVRASLGSVDEEKGRKWVLSVSGDHVNGTNIPGVWGSYDLGVALPLPHSSVWLRSAAGVAFGDRSDPFANYYFGGFGNNWIDHGDEKRYRHFYSFPGLELNEVGGRNFAKSTLEWNLPPIRFRHFGSPGFYLTWARPALFTGALQTNVGAPPGADPGRRTFVDAGVQVDFRFNILSRLDMTLSLGYAGARERGGEAHGDEFMASLKILR